MGFKLGHFPAAAGIILFTPLILHLYLFAYLDFKCRGSRFQIWNLDWEARKQKQQYLYFKLRGSGPQTKNEKMWKLAVFVDNMGFKLGHFPAAAGIILFTPLILHLYLFAYLDFKCRGSRFQIWNLSWEARKQKQQYLDFKLRGSGIQAKNKFWKLAARADTESVNTWGDTSSPKADE